MLSQLLIWLPLPPPQPLSPVPVVEGIRFTFSPFGSRARSPACLLDCQSVSQSARQSALLHVSLIPHYSRTNSHFSCRHRRVTLARGEVCLSANEPSGAFFSNPCTCRARAANAGTISELRDELNANLNDSEKFVDASGFRCTEHGEED